MTTPHSIKKNDIICDCTGTTRTKIEKLITKGRNTAEKITSATGAGTGCGSCDSLIIELLNKVKI